MKKFLFIFALIFCFGLINTADARICLITAQSDCLAKAKKGYTWNAKTCTCARVVKADSISEGNRSSFNDLKNDITKLNVTKSSGTYKPLNNTGHAINDLKNDITKLNVTKSSSTYKPLNNTGHAIGK